MALDNEFDSVVSSLNGVNAIRQERIRQIEIHGHTVESDLLLDRNTLELSAASLIASDLEVLLMKYNKKPIETKLLDVCSKLLSKRERLVVAGALIAAAIDIIDAEDRNFFEAS